MIREKSLAHQSWTIDTMESFESLQIRYKLRDETGILLAGSRSMNARERIVTPDKTIKHESEFWEYKRTILYECLKLHSIKSINKTIINNIYK